MVSMNKEDIVVENKAEEILLPTQCSLEYALAQLQEDPVPMQVDPVSSQELLKNKNNGVNAIYNDNGDKDEIPMRVIDSKNMVVSTIDFDATQSPIFHAKQIIPAADCIDISSALYIESSTQNLPDKCNDYFEKYCTSIQYSELISCVVTSSNVAAIKQLKDLLELIDKSTKSSQESSVDKCAYSADSIQFKSKVTSTPLEVVGKSSKKSSHLTSLKKHKLESASPKRENKSKKSSGHQLTLDSFKSIREISQEKEIQKVDELENESINLLSQTIPVDVFKKPNFKDYVKKDKDSVGAAQNPIVEAEKESINLLSQVTKDPIKVLKIIDDPQPDIYLGDTFQSVVEPIRFSLRKKPIKSITKTAIMEESQVFDDVPMPISKRKI